MNSKKQSTIFVAICVCALVVLSVFVFPFILAATPGTMEIETIEPEDTFPAEEPGSVSADGSEPESDYVFYPGPENEPAPADGPDPAIDINAISREQAIAIAIAYYDDMNPETFVNDWGETRTSSCEFADIKYMESTDPASAPSWFAFFSYRTWGETHDPIPEKYTPEEYLVIAKEIYNTSIIESPNYASITSFSLGTNSFGKTVVLRSYDIYSYSVVEINALTGEYVGYGIKYDELSDFDRFISDAEFREFMDNWWVLTIESPVEHDPLAPEPTPQPEFMPTPEPTSAPAPHPNLEPTSASASYSSPEPAPYPND